MTKCPLGLDVDLSEKEATAFCEHCPWYDNKREACVALEDFAREAANLALSNMEDNSTP